MEISTVNTVIGATLVFIGSCVLYVVGSIRSYIKDMDANMKAMHEMVIEHKVKINNHSEWLEKLEDKVYKLNRAAILLMCLFLLSSCHRCYYTSGGSDRWYKRHKKEYKDFEKYYQFETKKQK